MGLDHVVVFSGFGFSGYLLTSAAQPAWVMKRGQEVETSACPMTNFYTSSTFQIFQSFPACWCFFSGSDFRLQDMWIKNNSNSYTGKPQTTPTFMSLDCILRIGASNKGRLLSDWNQSRVWVKVARDWCSSKSNMSQVWYDESMIIHF